MRYLSVCSGIESATVAWHPLGWAPVAFAEIEKFPSAVLAHHYPSIPNLGDITKFKDWPDAALDVLVGGTPCQSFSVAGLRQGLADPRGNLCLTYLAIADRYRPEWILWENVPGVLSSDGGRDFGAFLGGLGQLGYGWSYRVLDAQYVRVDGFGRAVPQRRRRVFVVGNLRDWRRAAAILFERESLQGNTPPRREARKGIAGGVEFGPSGGCLTDIAPTMDARAKDGPIRNQLGVGAIVGTLNSSIGRGTGGAVAGAIAAEPGMKQQTYIAFDCKAGANTGFAVGDVPGALRGEGHGGGHAALAFDQYNYSTSDKFQALTGGTGTAQHNLVAFSCKDDGGDATENVAPTLRAGGFTKSHANAGVMPAVAIQERAVSENLENGPQGKGYQDDLAYTLEARNKVQAVATSWAVRRLTPVECSRLQGFPDDYLTSVPWRDKSSPPDGPMYKALGNSMSVNCMRWLGTRIQMVSEIADAQTREAAE